SGQGERPGDGALPRDRVQPRAASVSRGAETKWGSVCGDSVLDEAQDRAIEVARWQRRHPAIGPG
ncbi:MAG: hypothetical protein Q7J04_01675, partial [Microcella sp.]|nr:hypothetical protein [Microcella sp.]